MHGAIDSARQQMGGLEELARGDSFVHRLDARAKLLTTLVLAATAISYPKYALAAMTPLVIYPIVVAAMAGVPARALAWRLLPVAPLVLLIGAANPWLDRTVVGAIGGQPITGGWVSFASIALRLLLTVLAALLLVATTGIHGVARALERLGVPAVLTTQVLLMERYLWVLTDEARRVLLAHRLRGGGHGVALRLAGPLAGQLLLRALDRAQRIHHAMLARGFDGHLRSLAPRRFGRRDAAWLVGWCAFCLLVRWIALPHALGNAVLGMLQ